MGSVLRYYISGLYRELGEKPIFLWAQAVAFKVLIALVPILLLATGVFGFVLKSERPFQYVGRALREVFPAYGADELVAFLSTIQASSGRFTILGAIGIILASVTLFTTLRSVLGHIFSEDWHEQRTPLRGYLFDLRMAGQTGVLLLASVAVTVFMQTEGNLALTLIGMQGTWVSELWTSVAQISLLVLPFALSAAMFFQLYWFIPIPRPPRRAAFVGAMTGALLWELAKIGITSYAGAFGLRNGWQSALDETFLLIILIVLWAYYSGLILSLGALVALLYERMHREPPSHDAGTITVETASSEMKTHVPDL
ncbi:MAG: membrane protein [Rhodothermales bacterium]|jgi:membrane protein